MSYEVRAYDKPNNDGFPPDPVVVLVATGTHDVSRLVNLFTSGCPTIEQIRLAQQIRGKVLRHNGGRAALRLLAEHGGPDFAEDDDPGLDRYCDWPGCLTIWHAIHGAPGKWLKSRHQMLCPDHSNTEHWADYTTDTEGNVDGATCRCGHRWDEAPISLAVLKAWWQQHVATQPGDQR